MRVLVLGASGMLGNAIFRLYMNYNDLEVFGTVRNERSKQFFDDSAHSKLLTGIETNNIDSLVRILEKINPDAVINCIGLVKQNSQVDDPLEALPINSILPHRLARLCAISGSRFIHMSTDCVFSGSKGMYSESDRSDATDLYGISKYLGEVDYPNAVTLRTSIIGHELENNRSLVSWFLSQNKPVRGYTKAVFSGLPTVEIAHLIRNYVLPNNKLRGVYHVSSDPINKYDLLNLVAHAYGKNIPILPDDSVVIDRSLDSSRFRSMTGFKPKSWSNLVASMREFG